MTTTPTQFSTRDLPWTKIGKTIDKAVSSAKAVQLAGLNFQVERMPLSFTDAKGKHHTIEGRSALVDPKTSKHYGIVADGYEIVQYSEAFAFVDSLAKDKTPIVAAGALKGGKQAFIVVKAPEMVLALGDDPHDMYVVMRTSHDCTKAIEINIMPLRGMCMNQMPVSTFSNRVVQRWSIRHTKSAKEQLAEAHNTLRNLDEYTKEYTAVADHLARIKLDRSSATEILEVVLPDRTRREDQVAAITGMLSTGENVGHHDTGWGLVNAVGEYFEHTRFANHDPEKIAPEARLLNALSGSTRKYINHTAQVLMSMEAA